ncbi:guided entry of tail-anchored proteins factor 1-like [Glandiceps talaboti]
MSAIVIFIAVFFLSCLHALNPYLVRLILRWTRKDSEEEFSKHQELKDLRKDLYSISAQDEFARYARIQRKINKLTEELGQKSKNRSMVFMKYQWSVIAVLYALQVFVYLFLIWKYYQQPVVLLDPEWLFPIATVLSIPTGVSGAVGITCWLFVCSRISRVVLDGVK